MLNLPPLSPPTGYVKPDDEVLSEYPKFLHFEGKPSIIAQSKAEEDKLLSGKEVVTANVTRIHVDIAPIEDRNPVPITSEKDALISQANIRGVKIDKRWGTDKIKAALAA